MLEPGRLIGSRVFFQDGVGVDAAESECVDAGAAGMSFETVNPGSGLGVEIKVGLLQPELGVGILNVQRGRKHFVMQRQRGLDETGHAARGHGVADHRFDGAESAAWRLAVTLAEDAAQASHSVASPTGVLVP